MCHARLVSSSFESSFLPATAKALNHLSSIAGASNDDAASRLELSSDGIESELQLFVLTHFLARSGGHFA
jgi:hypothetical protein